MLSQEDLNRVLDAYPDIELDRVGHWTILKERIISYYMKIYSKILSSQRGYQDRKRFTHYYLDGFSSTGIHIDRRTKEWKPGSAYYATKTDPPFDRCIFIDKNDKSIMFLRSLIQNEDRCEFIVGDCNQVLPRIFQDDFHWSSFRRALCFLDPYGLDVEWATVLSAGSAGKDNDGKGTVECFINYPQHDIQRNVLRKNRAAIDEHHVDRMNAFWGDDSWQRIIFQTSPGLFGDDIESKAGQPSRILVEEYMRRLKANAGFNYVNNPFSFTKYSWHRHVLPALCYQQFYGKQKSQRSF